jgi:hypothetical protein
MKSLLLISLTASLVTSNAVLAKCPVLDLQTLPKALCADQSAPMTQTGGNMAYVSKNAANATCSQDAKSLSFKKKIQNLFKGSKDYNGKEKIIQQGVYACDYTLPASWKDALGTGDATFSLNAKVGESVTSGLSGQSLCPKIDWKAFKALEEGNTLSVKMGIISGGQTLEWDLAKKLDKKLLSKIFGSKAPSDATPLTGTARIATPFKNECTYTYHPDGKEQTLTLVGTHVK